MSITEELANLPTNVIPDLRVSTREETRQADLIDSLLPEAYYTVQLKKWEVPLDRDGNRDPRRIKLTDQLITEADEQYQRYVGRHVRFIQIFNKPYTFGGKTTSGLNEYLRGINEEVDWQVGSDQRLWLVEAAKLLDYAVEMNVPIRIKFQWSAFNMDYFNDLSRGMEPGTKEYKAARKQATVRGMRNFPVSPDGNAYVPEVKIDGTTCEAEVVIDKVIPSLARRS